MQVLVFRHVPFEHLGLIADALARRGLAFRYVDLYLDPKAPVVWQEAAGLIFMGGPMSANDELEFLRREMAILEAAAAADRPVLGVCLGAQLIARAAGARVYRNPVKEIGWAPVYWTEQARHDALFAGLKDPETVFHWHSETFDLPRGAAWLASSQACQHQAFRLGSNVWGLQFHLEVTPEMIAEWCAAPGNQSDVAELGGPVDAHQNAGRLAELASMVFGRWAELAAAA